MTPIITLVCPSVILSFNPMLKVERPVSTQGNGIAALTMLDPLYGREGEPRYQVVSQRLFPMRRNRESRDRVT